MEFVKSELFIQECMADAISQEYDEPNDANIALYDASCKKKLCEIAAEIAGEYYDESPNEIMEALADAEVFRAVLEAAIFYINLEEECDDEDEEDDEE